MTAFSEPTKWAQALGATANVDVIPDTAGAMDVDISKIFPAVFSVPLSQGGKAIPRRTLNGILKLLGDWLYYYQQGGVASYSNTVDYVVGRVVLYTDGNLYKCIQDNVHTDPHNPTDKDYWDELSDASDLNGKADRSLSNVDNTANILMAHNAMPSSVYDSLTLGANGSRYTAPADGYFSINIDLYLAAGGYLHLMTVSHEINKVILYQFIKGVKDSTYGTYIPIKKGDMLQINYDKIGTVYAFNFVYAVGSESEQ